MPIPPNLQFILQQLGLPPFRPTQHGLRFVVNPPHPNANVNANVNPNAIPNNGPQVPAPAAVPEIPFRPLIVTLAMLAIRTLLLLYLVSPARKPVFAMLILAWVVYEGWRPIREGLRRWFGRGVARPEQQQQQPQQEQQNGLGEQAGVAGQPAPARPGNAAASQGNLLLESLANMNLGREEAALAGTGPQGEPGIVHKAVTFVVLLVVTMHPGVWDRRRAALGKREGRVRSEDQERHGWVQRYIERIRDMSL
jgi:hypothetical protein